MATGQGCEWSKAIDAFNVVLHHGGHRVTFDPIVKSKKASSEFPPDRLQWETTVGVPKERRYVRVSRVGNDVEIVPFNNDIQTLQRAVVERVFTVKSDGRFARPPRPAKGHFDHVMTSVKGLLGQFLPSTAPISHQQFVDSYKGRKKDLYQRALDEIRATESNLENDAKLNVFVKFEKTDRTTKVDPVPRVISPRDPKFNIRVGRYLKPLEERLFKSLGKMFGTKTVLKGVNAQRSAELLREKWDMFRNPVAVGLDASRFDQHVSIDALRWEHGVYMSCFPQLKHRERLRRLLKLQELNHCTGYTPDGMLKYNVKGTRMSGDMNTSLGNCVLMCSMIKAYLLWKGIDGQLANNGDDCVVFMEKADLAKFSDGLYDWFLALGFNMAIEAPVFEFDQIEFCQTKPVFDGQGWIMCRNPHTAINKDAVMLKPFASESEFKGWLDAVGTGGLAMAGGLPVFQELYRSYQRCGQQRKISEDLLPWSFTNLNKGMTRQYTAVHPAARASFYWAFDITPDEQIALEMYYSSLQIGPSPGSYEPRGVFA